MKRSSIVSVRVAVVLALAFAVGFGTVVLWRSSRAMQQVSEDVRAEHEFRFTVRPLAPAFNIGFEAVSSPAVFLQAARFQDHLYLAGPAGLQEYAPEWFSAPSICGRRRASWIAPSCAGSGGSGRLAGTGTGGRHRQRRTSGLQRPLLPPDSARRRRRPRHHRHLACSFRDIF